MKDKILNNNDEYTIVIDNFEGPFDLLLYLISKNKMDIFDISISNLTDTYIEYLNDMTELNLDFASNFIVMASTLLNIKSKKLLPELEEKEEEVMSEEDILSRIIEYKMYKEICKSITELYKFNFGTFEKPIEKFKFMKKQEYIGQELSTTDIYNVYNGILNKNINRINTKSNEIEKLILYEKITVKDKAKQIISYLNNNEKLVFNNMFDSKLQNIEIITAFLGTLELSKLKQIFVQQEQLFSDIYITKNIKADKYEYEDIMVNS